MILTIQNLIKTGNVFVRNTISPTAPLWFILFYHLVGSDELFKAYYFSWICFFLPLTLKDDLDLDLSPLKMCSSMRYTCMPNMKLLSSILQKLWQNVKVWRKQTHKQTNIQGKNNNINTSNFLLCPTKQDDSSVLNNLLLLTDTCTAEKNNFRNETQKISCNSSCENLPLGLWWCYTRYELIQHQWLDIFIIRIHFLINY